MLYGIRTFISQIKNLIRWFPIIWNDRDWSHDYIFDILKAKLKFQALHISKHDNHTCAAYDAERMLCCVRLIEKIQDEYYAGEYMDYAELKFNWLAKGKPELELYELQVDEISENYDAYFDKHKAAVRKVLTDKKLQIFDLNGQRYKQNLAMNVAQYNEKRAQDLLFRLLNRDIRGWWC